MEELYEAALNPDDTPLSRDELVAAMQDTDVLVPTVTDRIDADMIAAAGDRLGLIANFGAGTDHIDLKAAAARKIIVTNTPGVFTDDTADLAMAMIIGVPRRIRDGVALIRRGEWTGWTPSGLRLVAAASLWAEGCAKSVAPCLSQPHTTLSRPIAFASAQRMRAWRL